MTSAGGRKGRRLSSEEQVLWDGVARSVKPNRKRAKPPTVAVEPAVETKSPPKFAGKKSAIKPPSPPPAQPVEKQKRAPSLSPLERRLKQKIARGNRAIDGRLDLHGHTQSEAHDSLLRFLRMSQARGGSVVLVITGKGGRGDGDRGVLKRAVPQWLALPEFREMVIGFDDAAVGHGGTGALYVRLRKRRES